MTISGVARQFLYAAALGAALGGLASLAPAFAQAFGYGGGPYGGPPPGYGGYPGYGPPPGYGPRGYDDQGPRFGGRRAGAPFASRRAIAGLLAERGLRLDGPLDFEGPNIVAIGVDPVGHARRFVIDPYQGEVIAARPLPHLAARPEGYGPESAPGDLPPPPMARSHGPAPSPENQPLWRDEPLTTGSIPHSAKTRPAGGESHPAEPHKAPPAVEASAAPAAPSVKAAPTGELEAPKPGG
jgi:hypothetical protein